MMHVTASAPGKLVACGDYAVLEGAPAVVLALDRRANVELDASSDHAFHVEAADLGIHDARAQFDGAGLRWASAGDASRLMLVTAVLEALAPRVALRISLDTRAFFAGMGGAKLGLGSSAALTVALAGALHAACARPAPELRGLLAMHRALQDGRGSGLDIAASLLGGAQVYRLRDGNPDAARVTWPQDLAFCCVWSGRAASTGAALAQLAAWRGSHPAAYNIRMHELTTVAEAVAAALAAGDAGSMAGGLAAYADGLARLGDASGIDIVSAEHRVLAQLATACGVAYKTCGAGGGDVGMAVATDPDRLTHFVAQATNAGFRVLDTGIDARGLRIDAPITNERRPAWTTYA